jgi:hypothetical protein
MEKTVDEITEKNYKNFYVLLKDKLKFGSESERFYLPLIADIISNEESRHQKMYESALGQLNKREKSNLGYIVLNNLLFTKQ